MPKQNSLRREKTTAGRPGKNVELLTSSSWSLNPRADFRGGSHPKPEFLAELRMAVATKDRTINPDLERRYSSGLRQLEHCLGTDVQHRGQFLRRECAPHIARNLFVNVSVSISACSCSLNLMSLIAEPQTLFGIAGRRTVYPVRPARRPRLLLGVLRPIFLVDDFFSNSLRSQKTQHV